MRTKAKFIILILTLSLGTVTFGIKYRDYFGRGATSVGARVDYWRAAWETLAANPVLGSGPGTFMVSYQKLKPPEAEMTRLVHNDFLQQGSDSGWVGLLAYAVLVWGSIGLLHRKCRADSKSFSVWLGLVGLALQSFLEFGLYIPALAWPFFLLLGWLLGTGESRFGSTSKC
jgi:O-antigen ligase